MEDKDIKQLTLGSLFDGSGGFPLGGCLCGIKPIWASEIEPFPIAVTHKRFPDMKHLGDVSKINGKEIEPVDIITFGSPCQDLSLAGKRAGLGGSRSGLFFEAIRIIKEMKEATNGEYPKYAIWENVAGAFSSNGGDDFRAVLEAFARVAGTEIDIPRPEKWEHSGYILGDGFSVGWRLFDAQFWGVPQRRKRIYLVADFTDGGAGKILFESEGLSKYSAENFGKWKEFADSFKGSIRGTELFDNELKIEKSDKKIKFLKNPVIALNDQGGHYMTITKDMVGTLMTASSCIIAEDNGAEGYKPRLLTPIECARLQGFPDSWCSDLGTENPTNEDMLLWRKVWDTWCDINGVKRKSDKQIKHWLKNPYLEASEYKLWGNGVALPCVYFVLAGIEWYEREKDNIDKTTLIDKYNKFRVKKVNLWD